MLAVLAGEFEAERFLQCAAQRCQTRQTALPFDARLGVTRVGRQKPRYLFGGRKGRGLQQHTGQIFIERLPDGIGEFPWVADDFPERLFGRRDGEGFQRGRLAIDTCHDDEFPQIGNKHEAVFVQVFRDLLAARHVLQIFIGCFDFNDTPRRNQPVCERIVRLALLVCGYQGPIGKARPDAPGMDNAAHRRFEFLANEVQEIRKVRIIGGLFYAHPAYMRVAEVCEKTLDMCVFWQVSIIAQKKPFQELHTAVLGWTCCIRRL
jgi:hypothetical protein